MAHSRATDMVAHCFLNETPNIQAEYSDTMQKLHSDELDKRTIMHAYHLSR
jgi:hypothetical protein